MKRLSGGTSMRLPNRPLSDLYERVIRSSKTSAIAMSLVGPVGEESALETAPVPRPPQPTKASRIVLSSPPYTRDIATPVSTEPATTFVLRARNCLREDLFDSVGNDFNM